MEKGAYLVRKYCAVCFEPLDNDFDTVCPSCGQKTTAININKRLKLDETVDKKYRNAPNKTAAVFGAAAVIQLVYAVFAILIILGLMSKPSSGVVSEVSSISFQRDESDPYPELSKYIEKARKYDTYEEFLDSCRPLKYEPKIYTYAWNVAGLTRQSNAHKQELPKDPVPAKEDSTGSTVLWFGGGFGILLFSFIIYVALLVIWYCIRALREKDKTLVTLWGMSEYALKTSIVTLNFISLGLYLWGIWYLDRMELVLGSGKMRASRHQKIYKARNPLGDTNEWCCEFCGYINEKRDSECKSCGKYR